MIGCFTPCKAGCQVTMINKCKDSEENSSGTRGQITQEIQNGPLGHGKLVQISYDPWFSGPEGEILTSVFGLPELCYLDLTV